LRWWRTRRPVCSRGHQRSRRPGQVIRPPSNLGPDSVPGFLSSGHHGSKRRLGRGGRFSFGDRPGRSGFGMAWGTTARNGRGRSGWC
jgi:hypothetical protein